MGANITARTGAEVAALLAAADRADRDADGEFPGSYYRKAHRARARRLRTKAAKLAHGQPDPEPEYTSDDAPSDDDPSLTETEGNDHG